MSILASDLFNRANETTLLSPWTLATGWSSLKLVSNAVEPVTANTDSWMYYSGPTWPQDQYAKITVGVAGVRDFGPIVRMSATGQNGYLVQNSSSGQAQIYKSTGGGFALLASPAMTDLVSGDTLELWATGSTNTLLTVKKNGTLVGTYTDSTSPITAAGAAGIYCYGATGSIDAFEGGDFASGGPTITSTSTATPSNGISLTITGTTFGATQGAGGVTVGGIAQTVTAWSDTSITITVDRGTNKYGTSVNIIVTDSTLAASSPYALTSLQPQSGWSYINLTTPASSGFIITASGILASGDQLAYNNVGSLVAVYADSTFSADASVLSFAVEAWTPSDGWGTIGTQTTGIQILKPISDITSGTWTPSTGGTLYGVIDESPYNDTDFIGTVSSSTCEVGISTGVDPTISYGHTINYRAYGNGTLTIHLVQGTTVLASKVVVLTGSYQNYTWHLTSTQVDSITDYSNLRLRFVSS